MKFIENYQDRPWAALALSPKDRDELVNRLDSGSDDIVIEDMFEQDGYKIERIRIVSDWSEFTREAEERDTNVKWTTRIMWAVVVIIVMFALIGVFSAVNYIT